MSLFEFLMVLVSIIIGLGVAEILSGVASMIRGRDVVRCYWVHLVVVAAIFIALLQQWWEAWGLRTIPEWTFFGLLMLLAGPIGLFLLAHLLFPRSERTDFDHYYYNEMRPFWIIGVATVTLGTLFRPLALGHELLISDNFTSAVFVVAFAALAVSKHRRLHEVVAPVIFALLVFDVVGWNFAMAE